MYAGGHFTLPTQLITACLKTAASFDFKKMVELHYGIDYTSLFELALKMRNQLLGKFRFYKSTALHKLIAVLSVLLTPIYMDKNKTMRVSVDRMGMVNSLK